MRNWAGNQDYHARRVFTPRSIEELQELVRSSSRIRALGTRHAFSAVADTDGDLVSLADIPRRFEVDAVARTVTIDGGARYGDVCGAIDDAGFALHNLASLPHIGVAGAVATGTHGSGDRLGNLATAVVGIELVRADGELVRIDRSPGADPALPLDGTVVALGALGVVTALTLAVEPSYAMRQDVFEDVPFSTALQRFDELTAAAAIVSLFTDWSEPAFHQVWLKRRVPSEGTEIPPVLGDARPARTALHPIRGLSPEASTPQLGEPGPWHARLPHFRLDHIPSAGAELQSEYLIAREDAPAALAALGPLARRLAPLVWVTEVRTMSADTLWLSPAYGRDTVGIHFTWKREPAAVAEMMLAVEERLARFEPRPHWGKLSSIPPEAVRDRYPERGRFVEVAHRLDPSGTFRNAFVDAFVFA
ncbi:MAG TPA: D-arabinono-1,4-lactone oxidase [Candidatus Limnocylindrales bacterium]|nr:D-arabinono-1,4-lactone oxidase [Candidatus Limnocylindrales bacterium]